MNEVNLQTGSKLWLVIAEQWDPTCGVDLEATLDSVRELARKAINILEDKGLIKDEFWIFIELLCNIKITRAD